ncbi:MAG: hypothetical protein IIV97_02060 [Oscillospiraceae bacterium]|nr:hypothetical protein [Oscillospiraceae bacterium]
MDWKLCAVDDLRQYKQIKIGVINSKERLRMLKKTVKNSSYSPGSGQRRLDTAVINALVEGERLGRNITSAEQILKLTERGLGVLDDEEKRVLEKLYMSNSPKTSSLLARELGYEVRTLYRLRDRALQKFTLAMYGAEIS